MTVKNHLCNVLWKFFIKIESTWRREIKEEAPQLTLLYCDGRTIRNSHRRCSIKKAVLKNFTILQYCFLHLCWSKVAGLNSCSFIKKKPQRRCFPVNIAKFLRLPNSKNICDRLLLTVLMLHCYMGLKVQGLHYIMASGFRI